jgi:DNA repair protein RadC
MAAVEFSRRFLLRVGIRIDTDEDILPLVEELRTKKQEFFLTFTLDGGNHLIEKRTVFIGTLTQALVHPRDVFADAIADRAAGIIFVHNHPVTEAVPSAEDILVTNRLVEVAHMVGINVVDHIIITKNHSFSFKNKGLLANR